MEVPLYPDSREIEIKDKPNIDAILERLQPRVSELCFANLYLFRRAHSYRLSKYGDSHLVLGRGYDGGEYFLPPLDGNVEAAVAALLEDGRVLYGCDGVFVDRYLKGREDLESVEERDSFDYLYLRESLAELSGNRYHKKKNRINYFKARHQFRVEAFEERHLKGGLDLLEQWRSAKSEIESVSLDPESEAAAEGLVMAKILGLEGVVVLVEGKVRAFALGERLNGDTSVLHFEKGDPFLEGIYQLVDMEFNRRCFTGCAHVNREQDLGESPLRNSKLSYHPVELVKKFRAWKRPA